MKNIPLHMSIVICIFIISVIFGYEIFSSYQLEKLKLETEQILNQSAIKAGMVQVPVDICTELHQELKWVNSDDYNSGMIIDGIE